MACQASGDPTLAPSGAAADVPRAGWFQLSASVQDSLDGIATTGLHLSFGRIGIDARVDVIEPFAAPLPQLLDLAAPAAIAVVTDSTIRVTFEDGAVSWVRTLDVASGKVLGSIELEDVVAGSVADPAGRTTWLMLRDRASLRSIGLWRLDRDGSLAQVRVGDPSFDPEPLRGERVWLALWPTASTLVRWVCDGRSCRMDAIDLASGARRFVREGLDFGRLLGVGETDAVVTALPPTVRAACMATERADRQALCPLSLITLATGAVRAGPLTCEDDVVVPIFEPLTVVVASEHPACGGDRYRVAAFDIATDQRRSIALTDPRLQLVPESAEQGTNLSGSFIVSPTGDFRFAPGHEAATIVALPE